MAAIRVAPVILQQLPGYIDNQFNQVNTAGEGTNRVAGCASSCDGCLGLQTEVLARSWQIIFVLEGLFGCFSSKLQTFESKVIYLSSFFDMLISNVRGENVFWMLLEILTVLKLMKRNSQLAVVICRSMKMSSNLFFWRVPVYI